MRAMLAYLFWHERRPEVDSDRYVALLEDFHRALAAAPPPGFRRSWSVTLQTAPWAGGPGEPFEDWYLADDWAALGTLNDQAVRPPRQDPHDAVAAQATNGAGAVYALQHGDLDGPRPWAGWLAKPDRMPYDTFVPRLLAALEGTGAAVLRRQMVLGPAPEYAVLADREPQLPWPVRATGPRPLGR
jgi:hypothetical protein